MQQKSRNRVLRLLIIGAVFAATPTPSYANSAFAKACAPIVQIAKAFRRYQDNRELKKGQSQNANNLAAKKRVLPLATPTQYEQRAPVSKTSLEIRAARWEQRQNRSRDRDSYDGFDLSAREAGLFEDRDVQIRMPLAEDIQKIAVENIYETSQETRLVHGSEDLIPKFDVDYNSDILNIRESINSGPGVYTFRSSGSDEKDFHDRHPRYVYEFEIPKGTTVMDLNDPGVEKVISNILRVSEAEYEQRVQRDRERLRLGGKPLGLSDHDLKRSYAIDELWGAVGKPDLIIGSPYGESEIVIRNPSLVETFTTRQGTSSP